MKFVLTVIKYIVFFFNFAFVIFGIAMITLGAFVLKAVDNYKDFIDYDLTPFPILLIVVGCVVFLIAFLGCCGAIKESSWMMLLYSIIMILIFAIEIGIIVAAFVKRNDIENMIDQKLNETMHENEAFAASWHLLQTELKCCGIIGPQDWVGILPENLLPGSCCQKEEEYVCKMDDPSVIEEGCRDKLLEYFKSYLAKMAGVAIGVAVVQLLAITFSCYLYSAF